MEATSKSASVDRDGLQPAAGCLPFCWEGGGDGDGKTWVFEGFCWFFSWTPSVFEAFVVVDWSGLVLLTESGELCLEGGFRRFSLPGLTSFSGASCRVPGGRQVLCES